MTPMSHPLLVESYLLDSRGGRRPPHAPLGAPDTPEGCPHGGGVLSMAGV